MRTELANRMRGQGSNALASSIVLVYRKRGEAAAAVTRADFLRALKRAIDDIRKAGVGPVDMQQSVIGPGMGVFTRFSKVLEDDDSAMGVKTALALINRVWEDIETELDTNFDAETQVALAWFATYGFEPKPSGELITLANAKNIPLGALFNAGVFADLHGKAGLIKRENLPAGWTPASDKTLTVWECVQYTARILKAPDGGGDAAARFVAQMGSKPPTPARSPIASTKFHRKRAGPRKRSSTTSLPRNGRSSKILRRAWAQLADQLSPPRELESARRKATRDKAIQRLPL
jgi:putative DNA methylase